MINKNIFHLWIGDNPVMDYAYFSHDTYKKINPDFNCIFYIINSEHVNDIKNTKNQKLDVIDECIYDAICQHKNLLKDLMNTSYFHTCKYYTRILRTINIEDIDPTKPIIFNEIMRLEILEHIGGIYVDCDTFPIKPFDDKLLKSKNFQCTSYRTAPGIFRDSFFSGMEKGSDVNNVLCDLYPMKNYTKENVKDINYINLNKKFYNLKLKYGEHYEDPNLCYIDHYRNYSWSKQKGN